MQEDGEQRSGGEELELKPAVHPLSALTAINDVREVNADDVGNDDQRDVECSEKLSSSKAGKQRDGDVELFFDRV